MATLSSAKDGSGAGLADGETTLSPAAVFTFAATDNVRVIRVLCSLDGGTTVACIAPVTYAGLGLGPHTFRATALDATGNVSPAVVFSWSVVTPAQAVDNLIGAIASLGLPAGVATTLMAPLNNINTNHSAAACGKLSAFVNQLDGKVQNGQVMVAASFQLLRAAKAIAANLGCRVAAAAKVGEV